MITRQHGLVVPQFVIERSLQQGMTYEAYLRHVEEYAAVPADASASQTEKDHRGVAPLNLQRMRRIGKTFVVPGDVQNVMRTIARPQLWTVISEPWCGDSAQSIPYIAALASASEMVTLRFLMRDTHPDVMDAYLTEGSRSIPILIASGDDDVEFFVWGPRPRVAQLEFLREKAEGVELPVRLEHLHAWYGRNRGEEIVREMTERLSGIHGSAGTM